MCGGVRKQGNFLMSDGLIGVCLACLALGTIGGLTLWSRSAINWIADHEHRSVREILKQNDGK